MSSHLSDQAAMFRLLAPAIALRNREHCFAVEHDDLAVAVIARTHKKVDAANAVTNGRAPG